MNKKNNLIINSISDQFVTNQDHYVMDETFLGNNYALMIITNLKTRAILAYALKNIKNGNHTVIENMYQRSYKIGLNSEELLEIYELCVSHYQTPKKIHTDVNPIYVSNKIRTFAKQHNIILSTTESKKNKNNVAESVNNVIKTNILVFLQNKRRKNYRLFQQSWPDKFKNMNIYRRATNKEFRTLVFKSSYFNTQINVNETVQEAIYMYNSSINQKEFNSKFTREKLEKLNNHTYCPQPLQAKSKTVEANHIIEQNNLAFDQTNTILSAVDNLKDVDEETKLKIKQDIDVVQETLDINEELKRLHDISDPESKKIIKTIILTFSQQLSTNQKLQNTTTELLDRIKELEKVNADSNSMITELRNYINKIEDEKKIKKELAERRRKRKKRAQTQPFLREHYDISISQISTISDNLFISQVRFRVLLAFLYITGVRISEIQTIKVSQVLMLLKKHYITINRHKQGPAGHKAFLSVEGKKLLKERSEDIMILLDYLKIKSSYLDTQNYDNEEYNNLYFFSSQNSRGKTPLTRSFLTNFLNKNLQQIPYFCENNLNFTSHSLRHGFIYKLWKKENDIHFVKLVMGHVNIATTALYANHMPEEEIKERMEKISI